MNEFEAQEELLQARIRKLATDLDKEKVQHQGTLELVLDRGNRIIELAKVANELKLENEALRKDAERLSFMEKEWFYIESCGNIAFSFNEMWTGSGGALRSAIDAAIAEESQSD